jgi:hypothetical protein
VSIGALVIGLLSRAPRLQRLATRLVYAVRDRRRRRATPNLRSHIWDRFDDPPQCFYCDVPYSADTRVGECWGWSRYEPLRQPRPMPRAVPRP